MALYEPYFAHRNREPRLYCSSDSDLEPPQLLSEVTSPAETENDTPPETPLRATILDRSKISSYYGAKDTGNVELKTVYVAEPLIVATPHPIRPRLPSFRPFVIDNQERDCGYDSERETPVRPVLPRYRSFRRSPEVLKSSPLTTPKLGPSSGAGVLWNSDQTASPVLKRPRHPPPMEVSVKRDIGIQTDSNPSLTPLERLLADPNLDHAALWRGLVNTGLPFRVNKDRRNEVTGLGHGFPSSLAEDTSRIPTVVPNPAGGLYPRGFDSWISGVDNQELDSLSASVPVRGLSVVEAPIIGPVELGDEDEMSPLALPEPILAGIPSPGEYMLLQYTHGGDYVKPSAPRSASVVSEAEWDAHIDAMLLAELFI